MYLIYLDETGNTGKNLDDPNQPIHTISGIIIHEDKIQEIEQSVKQLSSVFLPYSQNFDFEFHGNSLFQGKGYFQHFGLADRLNVFEKMVELTERHNIPFFAQSIDKQKHKDKYSTPFHPHNVAFMYLIEKIDGHLEQLGERGIVVMDKCRDTEQQIINDFTTYKESGTKFGHFKREINQLVDTVMYVDSFNSNVVQMADVLSYIHASCQLMEYRDESPTNYHKHFIHSLNKRLKSAVKYSDIQPK